MARNRHWALLYTKEIKLLWTDIWFNEIDQTFAFRQRHISVCDLITILSNLFLLPSQMGSELPSVSPDSSRFPLGVILNPFKITDKILGEKWFMTEFLVPSHTLEILETALIAPRWLELRGMQTYTPEWRGWREPNFCGVLSHL